MNSGNLFSFVMIACNIDFKQKEHKTNTPTPNPMDTKTGRMTVIGLNEVLLPSRFAITCTRTRPTTSSSIAAQVVTVPSRVEIKLVVDRIVNVVPRLVALRATPAAKAWSELADTSSFSTNDRAIGVKIPVSATAIDTNILAFNALIDIDKPPV